MLYYIIAAALIVHTFFWGTGLSWLVLPRRLRRWWWVLAPGLGLALQSAVVWVGAHTPLAGTNRYALASELLPLALLGVAVMRDRAAAWAWFRGGRAARGLLAVVVLAGWALLWPMAQRGAWTLTSSSLGSCDHADYAAGARVLQEFSKDDRTGFLGQTEVTRVGGIEHFFDYWIRLNHFTPSALLAHNGAVFELHIHQLVSVSGVVLVLLNAGLVLMLARMAVGLRGVTALVPAAIYVFSPLGAYAVHHGALGQLYAAHGIGLLTLAVVGAGRGWRFRQSVWSWAPVALAAFWILAGSYNFILTVALAPAGAWLLAEAWLRRDWRGAARVAFMLVAAFAACVVLFWGRFDGMIERFRLFEQYDFGWPVPLLSPEGWLGMLSDTRLHAWPRPVRLLLSLAVLGAWLAGVFLLWRRKKDSSLAALALVLPVLAGWGMLVWEARTRSNASYDAFKLFSVFYPEVLAGLSGGLALAWHSGRRWVRLGAYAAVAVVLACNVRGAVLFAREMATPPLRVERGLLDVHRLEGMSRVTSLNMRIERFWSRLWANALLLRKEQYFPTHTYEGRHHTELKGEWDLSDSLLRSLPFRDADFVNLNAQFHAVRVAAPGRIELSFGDGWHAPEGFGLNRWRWNSGTAGIRLFNPSDRPLRVNLVLRVRGWERSRLLLELGEARIGGPRGLNGGIQRFEYEGLVVPPGASVLTLQNDQPPRRAAEDDPRMLAVALYEFTLTAMP